MITYSIVLFSDRRDHFYEAVSFAAAARGQGKTVLLFLRGPAVAAFLDDRWSPAPDARAEAGLEKYSAQTPSQTLAEIRAKGNVRVYACSAWVRMMNVDPAAIAAKADAVLGLNAFLMQAAEGPVVYIG